MKRHLCTLRLSTACPFTSNVALFQSISFPTVKHVIRIEVITVFCCNKESAFPESRTERQHKEQTKMVAVDKLNP